LTLNFDGSISKLIQELSGEKLIVKNLHHLSTNLEAIRAEALADILTIQGK
jgi:hypothetical protein